MKKDSTPQTSAEATSPGVGSSDLLAQLANEIKTDAAIEKRLRENGNKLMAHYYRGRVAAQQQIADFLRANAADVVTAPQTPQHEGR